MRVGPEQGHEDKQRRCFFIELILGQKTTGKSNDKHCYGLSS